MNNDRVASGLRNFTMFLTVVVVGVCFRNLFALQQESANTLDSSIQVVSFLRILPILVLIFLLIKYIHLIMLSDHYEFKPLWVVPYPRFWIQILELFLLYGAFFHAFGRDIWVYFLFGLYGLNTGLWMYVFSKERYIAKVLDNIGYRRRCLLFLRAVMNIFMGMCFLFGISLAVILPQSRPSEIYIFEAREVYYYPFLIGYCVFNFLVDISLIGSLVTPGQHH